MQSPQAAAADRRPVWAALSCLYLDSDLTPDDLDHLVRVLAASPYSAVELEWILLTEVHPACVANLLAVAGVWAGFDADWLQDRIIARHRARWRWPARLLPFRKALAMRAAPLFARAARIRQP